MLTVVESTKGRPYGSPLCPAIDTTDQGEPPARPYEEMAMHMRRLLHTRMRVNDLNQTIAFYRDVLGLDVVERHESPRGSTLAFLKAPGSEELIEICSYPASGPVRVPEDLVHLAFEVDDLDATIAELKQRGIPITDGPTTTSSGGRFAFIDAPERYEIELIERKPVARQPLRGHHVSTYDLQQLTARYYRLIRMADVDGFVDLFAPDGVSHDPVGAPPHVGHDGVRAFLTGVLGLCEQLDIVPVDTVCAHNRAAVTWSAVARGKNGSQTEFGGIDVFTFDQDRRIASLYAFWDATPVMHALTAARG